jgi:hypothetical protein
MTAPSSRPVFILGPERSGANLLAWSLGEHPSLLPVQNTGWLSRLALDLARRYEDAVKAAERSELGLWQVTRENFTAAFGGAAGSLIAGRLGEREERRWIDATPENALHVSALVWLFPEAKFIHIVRDADSNVALLRDREVSKPFRRSYSESAAWEHWLKIVEACVAAELAYGSDKILRVRHDRLVRSPRRVLEGCLRFLGEDWHDACLRPMRNVPALLTKVEQPQSATLAVRERARTLSASILAARSRRNRRDDAAVARLEQALVHRQVPGSAYLESVEARVAAAEARMAALKWELERSTVVRKVQAAVKHCISGAANVLVVSRGDDELLDLGDEITAGHFPQNTDGKYAGYHPANSEEAIALLEKLRHRGAEYLVFPASASWWLEHYQGFRAHLDKFCTVEKSEGCMIFALRTAQAAQARRVAS